MDPVHDGARPLRLSDPLLLLGAGRLGTHLAFHLGQAGATDLTLWSRSPLPPGRAAWLTGHAPPSAGLMEPASRAAGPMEPASPSVGPTTPTHPTTSSPRLISGSLAPQELERARVVLLTVSDDALAGLAGTLAALPGWTSRASFLHCSGALSSVVLEPLAARGCTTGSMHPLQSFSGAPVQGGIRGTWFAIEGHPQAIADGHSLVSWLEGHAVRLRPEGKVHYHTAAVIASNLLVALTSMAVDVMGTATGPEVGAAERLEVLLPLIEGTVANLRRVGLPAALTGPVSRGDAGVVARQLAALGASVTTPGPGDAGVVARQLAAMDASATTAGPGNAGAAERLAVYQALSRRALELARAQGLPDAQYEALEALLRRSG